MIRIQVLHICGANIESHNLQPKYHKIRILFNADYNDNYHSCRIIRASKGIKYVRVCLKVYWAIIWKIMQSIPVAFRLFLRFVIQAHDKDIKKTSRYWPSGSPVVTSLDRWVVKWSLGRTGCCSSILFPLFLMLMASNVSIALPLKRAPFCMKVIVFRQIVTVIHLI